MQKCTNWYRVLFENVTICSKECRYLNRLRAMLANDITVIVLCQCSIFPVIHYHETYNTFQYCSYTLSWVYYRALHVRDSKMEANKLFQQNQHHMLFIN